MAASDLLIAALRVEDAETVAVLQNSLWRLTYAGLLPLEVLAARDDETNIGVWRDRAAVHERDGRSAEGAVTLVAHDGAGVPVGWATTGPARDDDAPTATELWSLYVTPELHGAGVAQQLLAAVLPSSPAYAWVVRGNGRAIAFYRRSGFVLDGTTRLHEGLGAHELRMVRHGAGHD